MKVTIESKDIISLDGVRCRRWTGETDAGVPVEAFVHRISPQTHDADKLATFEAELIEQEPPRRTARRLKGKEE